MTSHLRVNMAAISLLLIAFLFGTNVRAYDFDELRMEDEVGSYTQGDLTHIIDIKASNRSWTGTNLYEDDDDTLRLICSLRSPLIQFVGNFKPFKNTVYPKKVAVCDCALPTPNLAQALKDLNISIPTIELLQYAVRNISEPLPTADYMQGLNLKTLFLDTALNPQDLFEKNPHFLKPLSNLTTLMVWGTQIPKVPENVHLEVLSLRYNATVKEWPTCKDLKVLSIHTVMASRLPSYWPEECQNLTKIKLKDLTNATLQHIISNFISPLVNLESLAIENCNLTDLPYEFLKNTKNLKYLNLTRNSITDETLIDVPFLQNLTFLDLSKNHLTGNNLSQLGKQMPNLKFLKLGSRKLIMEDFCKGTEIRIFSSYFRSLQGLSFKDAPISLDCFDNSTFSKLGYLNLVSTEKTEIINLRKLPVTDAGILIVDLRGRNVKWIEFNIDDYNAVRKGDYGRLWGAKTTNDRESRPHLRVFLDITEYHCRNHWICLALQQFSDLITIPNLNCTKSLSHFYLRADIEKQICTDHQNTCYIERDEDENDNGTIVRCNDVDVVDFEELSEVHRITKIDLRNNRISSLKNISIPESVEWIDLRGNKLTSLNHSDLVQLFKNPKRRMLLSNNTFVCDCEFVAILKEFQSKVEDFQNITCGNNKTLQELSTEKVCGKVSYHWAFIITAGVVFVIKIICLSWWYWNHVKRFFYRHGCCRCCCRSELSDAVAWQSVDPTIAVSQQDLIESDTKS